MVADRIGTKNKKKQSKKRETTPAGASSVTKIEAGADSNSSKALIHPQSENAAVVVDHTTTEDSPDMDFVTPNTTTTNMKHQELFRKYPVYILYQAAILSEVYDEIRGEWSDEDVQEFVSSIQSGELSLLHCSLLMNPWMTKLQQQQQKQPTHARSKRSSKKSQNFLDLVCTYLISNELSALQTKLQPQWSGNNNTTNNNPIYNANTKGAPLESRKEAIEHAANTEVEKLQSIFSQYLHPKNTSSPQQTLPSSSLSSSSSQVIDIAVFATVFREASKKRQLAKNYRTKRIYFLFQFGFFILCLLPLLVRHTIQRFYQQIQLVFGEELNNSASTTYDSIPCNSKIYTTLEQQRACSVANANLWIALQSLESSWDFENSHTDGNHPIFRHSPFAMHTIAIPNSEPNFYFSHHWKRKTWTRRFSSDIPHIPSVLGNIGASTINAMVRDTILHHASTTGIGRIIDKTNKWSSTAQSYNYSILDSGCGVGATMFSFLERMNLQDFSSDNDTTSYYYKESYDNNDNRKTTFFHYHGISMNGAEIRQAKREMKRRQIISSNKIKFDQLSFDDDPRAENDRSSYYSAIVAIESLSYSSNLTATLLNLSKVLAPGGILVIVDDFTRGHARNLLAAKSKATSSAKRRPAETTSYRSLELLEVLNAKPILRTDGQTWANALDLAGLNVQNITDLDLLFDLPQLREEVVPVATSRHPKLLPTAEQQHTDDKEIPYNANMYRCIEFVDLIASTIHRILDKWDDWKWPSVFRNNTTSASHCTKRISLSTTFRRVINLWRDLNYERLSRIVRRKVYEDGHLNYLMIVCQKTM